MFSSKSGVQSATLLPGVPWPKTGPVQGLGLRSEPVKSGICLLTPKLVTGMKELSYNDRLKQLGLQQL